MLCSRIRSLFTVYCSHIAFAINRAKNKKLSCVKFIPCFTVLFTGSENRLFQVKKFIHSNFNMNESYSKNLISSIERRSSQIQTEVNMFANKFKYLLTKEKKK